jgi:hypothetical protein
MLISCWWVFDFVKRGKITVLNIQGFTGEINRLVVLVQI